ncbi:hypothetical protein E2C01_059079 [Portunus trituberculatus]|uniref:Uncharacterized protein n=1 Tax=Portunus trituberculatus TaxID=210409 RepID=A0A5B7H4V3_PORTR|nr:hypothetical protein [Portunus trituberculatus]
MALGSYATPRQKGCHVSSRSVYPFIRIAAFVTRQPQRHLRNIYKTPAKICDICVEAKGADGTQQVPGGAREAMRLAGPAVLMVT